MHRWINEEKRRYYQVHLVRDLFGDWSLIACWGGLDSKLGGGKVATVASREAGEAAIEEIGKRRRQHGYRVTPQISLRRLRS